MSIWIANLLRVTAFPITPIDYTDGRWWDAMDLSEPDFEGLDKKNQKKTFSKTVEDEYVISLEQEPSRLDWILTTSKLLADISVDTAMKTFEPLIVNWLHASPPIKRLAFGANLLKAAETHSDGYRQLDALLPKVSLDDNNSSEFLYRINRPRVYNGIKINRISKWTLINFIPHITQNSPKYYCNLELDINTDGDLTNELKREQLKDIQHQLIQLGIEISTEGDIP